MKRNTLYTHGCVSALALTMGATLSAPAFAQTESADEAETRVEDTIFVTARKREETALEIPVSVSAFGQAALEERGVVDIGDLSSFVPGFDFEEVGTGGASGRANPQIRFRGVGVQIGDANARAGAIFWDGAYVADGIGIVPLVDLERTEVIKGPQTAFFGRNTFAGAVNFLSADPTESFEGRASGAIMGTDVDSGYNVNAVFSGPITDKLGARVAVSVEHAPGAYEFGDGTPLGEEQTNAILGSATYDLSDSTTFKYSGYFVDSEDTSVLSSINADVAEGDCDATYSGTLRDVITGEPGAAFTTDLSNLPGSELNSFATLTFLADDATLFCGSVPEWGESNQLNPVYGGAPPPGSVTSGFETQNTLPSVFGDFIDAPDGLGNTYETWRHHVSAESEFENGFTFNGFVSTGQFQNWGAFDNNYGLVGATEVTYRGFIRNSEDLSAEARITSPDEGRIRYMAGVNYYSQEAMTYQTGFDILTSSESEVYGIFGALDVDITDQLTLSAEGRFQDDTADLLQDGSPGTDFDEQSQSYSEFMPRVILSYSPLDDLNFYGSWSQSFLQGTQTGASSYAAAVPTAGLDPDSIGFFTPIQELNAFEIGVKQRVNSQFQYAVAAYNMEWENQAFFVLSPTFVSIALPGDSEYTGVEAEAEYTPIDWLTLAGSYNWVDGEFTDYVATGSVGASVLAPGLVTSTTAINANGNKIRYIPEHTGSFSATLDLDGIVGTDTFIRADAIFTGSFFLDNFEYNEVDESWKLNLRAGTALNDQFRIEVFGTNILDDRTPTTSGGTTFTSFFSQNTRRMFGQATRGTEWGVRLSADF